MSRPIKFMAWDKTNFMWCLDIQLYDSFCEKISRPKEYDIFQFTGLLDQDGKEIWEGSVVEWNGTKTEILWDEDCPGYIFGNDIPGQHGMECLDEDTAKTMKIIGHIAEEGKDE